MRAHEGGGVGPAPQAGFAEQRQDKNLFEKEGTNIQANKTVGTQPMHD